MKGLGWSGELGMVDTIFEEEEEEEEDLQSLSSPPFSSPSTPDLQTCVDAWSQITRRKPDVKIHVQGVSFTLHKEAVTSKSGHLRRQLKEVSELTLAPPLKVTVEAFKLFAQFCYQCDVVLTPSTLAPLRVAAELLDVAGDGDGLRSKAESYFSRFVVANREISASVFLSSLSLMPEAEQLAFLPSRCLEAISSMEDSHGGVSGCADCVKAVRPAEFRIIADSLQRRMYRSHDFLYELVDLYLKVYDGSISEDQKTRICNSIDCNMLSPQVLMHSVQNPRMPLRFIVQAMLMEQLNTHRSVSSAITSARLPIHHDQPVYEPDYDENIPVEALTLGALLQRDAALQQVVQLRAAIDTTSSRIQTLENELTDMKSRLIKSEKQRSCIKEGDTCGRSVSCRFNVKEVVNKVERGERGSISSSNLRFKALPQSDKGELVQDRLSSPNENGTTRTKKNLRQWLIKGFKSALRVSTSVSKKDLSKGGGCSSNEKGRDETNGVIGFMAEDHALASLTCIGDNKLDQGDSNMVDKYESHSLS